MNFHRFDRIWKFGAHFWCQLCFLHFHFNGPSTTPVSRLFAISPEHPASLNNGYTACTFDHAYSDVHPFTNVDLVPCSGPSEIKTIEGISRVLHAHHVAKQQEEKEMGCSGGGAEATHTHVRLNV